MLWALKRTDSMRQSFWVPKTGLKNHQFTFKEFAYLDQRNSEIRKFIYPPIWFFKYVFQILTERPESQLPWNLINISITQMTTSKIVVSCLTSKLSTVSKPVIFLAYFMLMIKPHH